MVRDYPSEITYSPTYPDGTYNYRHVTLTRRAAKEAWELTHHGKCLLTDPQWRGLGVVQSRGWEHYEIHLREPHILLFRRLLVPSQACDASGSLVSPPPINAMLVTVSGAVGSSLQHTCSASQACDASGLASQAHDASRSLASASSPIVKVNEEASDSKGLVGASEPNPVQKCFKSARCESSGSLASPLPINAVSAALGSSLQHTCSASHASGSARQASDDLSSLASASSPFVKVKEEASEFEGYSEDIGASAPDQQCCNPARRRINGKRSIGSDGKAVLGPYLDSRVNEGSD